MSIIGPLPNNIVNGDAIDAVPVMANFNWIVSQVNANTPSIVNTPITAFTPGLTFGGGSTGMTFASQSGFYTRVQNTVFFVLAVLLTAKGSSTGAAVITNLPIACNASWASYPTIYPDKLTFTGKYIMGFVAPAGTSIGLNEIISAAGNAQVNDTYFANNTLIQCSGFYQV
jgi:hypothetical protein